LWILGIHAQANQGEQDYNCNNFSHRSKIFVNKFFINLSSKSMESLEYSIALPKIIYLCAFKQENDSSKLYKSF